MRNFDWGTAIGFSLIIGFFCFLLSIGAAVTGAGSRGWVRLILAILTGTFTYLLAGVVQRCHRTHVFRYGVIWAVLALAGEFCAGLILATVRFAGFWEEWFGLALVLLAPWWRFRDQSAD